MSEIRTPPANDKYRSNYDRIFGKNRPESMKAKVVANIFANIEHQVNLLEEAAVGDAGMGMLVVIFRGALLEVYNSMTQEEKALVDEKVVL
jgi:hypothetical protein